MAGFSFNFSLDNGGDAPTEASRAPYKVSAPAVGPMRAGERFEWSPASEAALFAFSAVEIPPLRFETVNTADAGFLARTGAISAVLTTSDVQTGVYEGGFKLWECAVDLVRYMREAPGATPARVLELGCGHGLPGIYALQQGTSTATCPPPKTVARADAR
jgi:hypothetical protein